MVDSRQVKEDHTVLVVRGLPEEFYSLKDAEDYAEEMTQETREPHTLMVVPNEVVPFMVTTEYVGVRLLTTERYREMHRKDL